MKTKNDANELGLKFDPNVIFPLRLSPFEEYLYLDDRPSAPMTEGDFWIFEGRVDPELLQRALTRAAAYEPLLFARVVGRCGKLYWDVDKETAPVRLEVSRVSASVANMRQGIIELEYFNLKKDASGFRLVIGVDGFTLYVPTQHSLVDGCGITRFIGSVFDFYEDELRRARSEKGEAPFETCIDSSILPIPEELKNREKINVVYKGTPPSFWSVLRFAVRETFLWFARRPWNVAPLLRKRKRPVSDKDESTKDESTKDERPKIYWRCIPREDVERLRRLSKKIGVTFNTTLTSLAYGAFEKWRRSFDDPNADRRLRVLMPVNLRQSDQARMPLANMIGYVFLDRASGVCGEISERFLRDLNAQTAFIVDNSVGLCFVAGTRFFRKIPFALRFLTSSFFCHATYVFSNLGQVGYCFAQKRFRDAKTIVIEGELKLLRMIGAPPIRPNTPVSIGAISVENEVTLNFCIDDKVVATNDREALIEAFFNEISDFCRRAEKE